MWARVVEAMEYASTGSTTLDTMASYKVALPANLSMRKLDSCTTFCSNSSRPITFEGLSKDTCHELISNMLHWTFTNFKACARATIADSVNPSSETEEEGGARWSEQPEAQC
jgi:hypothetical protein